MGRVHRHRDGPYKLKGKQLPPKGTKCMHHPSLKDKNVRACVHSLEQKKEDSQKTKVKETGRMKQVGRRKAFTTARLSSTVLILHHVDLVIILKF